MKKVTDLGLGVTVIEKINKSVKKNSSRAKVAPRTKAS